MSTTSSQGDRLLREILEAASDKLRDLTKLLPSELIRVAAADLKRTVETQQIDGLPGRIEMNSWLYVDYQGTCAACLAGACIGNRLDLRTLHERAHSLRRQGELYGGVGIDHHDVPPNVGRVMRALDCFRQGGVTDALVCLDYAGQIPKLIDKPGYEDLRDMPSFTLDPDLFFEKLERLAAFLAANDL